MIRSISERSAPPQIHSSASSKPSPHLNVSDCYKLLKQQGDGREDAVMRQALELYCSLLTPPTTPLSGASEQFAHQHAPDTEPNEQYCSMSILSSYAGLSSASPRSSDFQQSPGNDYSLSYPKDLPYSMSTPSLSVSDRSSTDLDESNETDAYHSGTSRVFRPNSPDDSSLCPIGAASCSSASDIDDVDNDDPFARHPGVSRAPSQLSLSHSTSKPTTMNSPSAEKQISGLYHFNMRPHHKSLIDSKQAHFVFPKPPQKVQVYRGPAHLSVAPQVARTSYISNQTHVPPRRRMSSVGGSLCEGLAIPTEPLPSFTSPGSPTLASLALEDLTHSAQRVVPDAKPKSQRTRAMSVINFGFHRSNTSAPPPIPVLPPVISDPIPFGQPLPVPTKKVKGEASKLQQRSRSHTMSNSKIHPNDLYMPSRPVPPTMPEGEEEVASKANRRLTQKDPKSLWKALKKSAVGSGSSKHTSIDSLGPPTESLDRSLGRATAGGGMRYPSANRPSM